MLSFLNSYDEAFAKKVSTKKKNVADELSRIDEWLRIELPAEIRSRDPRHITSKDLGDLMKWKLGRGKFRPRLQQLAESNSAELVEKSSMAAFEKVDTDLSAAVDQLCVLKGVGPATASLILSCYAPDKAP